MTYRDFAILNSHVTVIYLGFIKNTYFYEVKQKLVKKNVRKSCIFKSVKKIQATTCRKVVKYLLAFDQDS